MQRNFNKALDCSESGTTYAGGSCGIVIIRVTGEKHRNMIEKNIDKKYGMFTRKAYNIMVKLLSMAPLPRTINFFPW